MSGGFAMVLRGVLARMARALALFVRGYIGLAASEPQGRGPEDSPPDARTMREALAERAARRGTCC
jgi:hypothetical protein